jgi:AraC-like DNA-binding protein
MEQHRPCVDRLLIALAEIIEALGSEYGGDRGAAAECARRAIAALESKPPASSTALQAGSDGQPIVRIRGGLAPWQVRLAATHIDTNLDTTLTTDALARLVRLSPSHFMRAFKVSFGSSPHRYIVRRRIAHAQGLMLTTDAPLGQIALECGLADQSHLAKLFYKSVGETPGAWRRSRIVPRAGRCS